MSPKQWRSQRGVTPPKISYSNLKGLTQEKGRKKMTPWNIFLFFWERTPWHLKVTVTQGKESKKKKKKNFSNIKSYSLFTYFTVMVSFSLVLTPISQNFFIFYFLFLSFFLLFIILFIVFYCWMMLEILQILLFIS